MSAMTNVMEDAVVNGLFRTKTVVARANSTAYVVGDLIFTSTNSHLVRECITAGTSAGAEPGYNNSLGDETTDGTAVFMTCFVGLAKRPIFVALFTAAPGEAGGGTEVSGGSYARVAVAPADANWDATAGGDGHTSNSAEITFPQATGSWGTVTDMAIMDRLTTGRMWMFATLSASKVVGSGDTFRFPIGNLDVTFA